MLDPLPVTPRERDLGIPALEALDDPDAAVEQTNVGQVTDEHHLSADLEVDRGGCDELFDQVQAQARVKILTRPVAFC